VQIGEHGKAGEETFHFIAASPSGLESELGQKGFNLVRGLILLAEFDVATVRRAIDNLLMHSRPLNDWGEIVGFLSRYARYDSEDLPGTQGP
jgi:hypothetical protein